MLTPMAEQVVRYTYRVRPGAQATAALLAEWDRCRWIWNQCTAAAKAREPWPTDKQLTAWRAEHDWLRAGSVVTQQQTIRDFRQAKGVRRNFKAKKVAHPSLNYTLRGFAVKDGRLRVAGGVSLPVAWSRDLPSDPSSVRIYRDSLGHWYASFVVRRDQEPVPESDAGIGVDWGVKTVATTTDPAYDLPSHGYARAAASDLAAAQRVMARRKPKPGQPGSKGYREAKRRAAVVHKRVARQRQDAARKWARRVVANHGLIAVEDFKSAFLAKSTMARKSADNAVATTKATLVEYAERAGRKVVLVPPAYTTMTCSSCGSRAKARLLLSERVFSCHACGLVEDRDRNAARVILATAGSNRADAEAVRHSVLPSGQVRVLAESGIPRL